MPFPPIRYLAFLLLFLLPAPVQAESLRLTFDKSLQTFPLPGEAPSTPAQTVRQTVTLYPQAYASRSGQTENIYDFTAKTFTVVNHSEKTYTVYPLHSVALFRSLDRTRRLNLKIALYQQQTGNASTSVRLLVEDVDIDMTLGSNSNNRTSGKIRTVTENGKMSFTHENSMLATATQGTTAVPPALRDTYARFIVYEFPVHPAIKSALGAGETVFKSLSFTNRDVFRGMAAAHSWSLTDVADNPASVPALPDDYMQIYHQDPELDAAFKAALAPHTFDAATFQSNISDLIDQQRYLIAFLTTQAEMLEMPESMQAAQKDTFTPGLRAAQNFERAVYLAIAQTPGNDAELRQYTRILEQAKPRAGEMAWLLDFYIARHTQHVLTKKQSLSPAEKERLETARHAFFTSIRNMPRYLPAYQQMGNTHYAALDIPTALLYWHHITALDPQGATAQSLKNMLAQTEKDFPEYF